MPRPARTTPLVGWALVGLFSLLSLLLYVTDRQRPLREGAFAEVDITLVSRDVTGLACALDGSPSGFSCGFDGAGQPRVLPAQLQLQPCVTLKREVLLVPGLFVEPAIQRASVEGGTGRGARRFTAHCMVRLLTRVRGARLRFVETEPFGPPEEAWLASPVGCSVAANGS